MINENIVSAWRVYAPWLSSEFIEQDLIISRTLVEIYNHPMLAEKLIFRGGTALQKIFYASNPTRYSEDIDVVQIEEGPIGPIFDALRETLEPWLGKPKRKIGDGVIRLTYIFQAVNDLPRKLKVEINTREHFAVFPIISKPFEVNSPWFKGKTNIKCFAVEELLGSKLRALYQRKKGRDLYDLAIAMRTLELDLDKLLYCFHKCMEPLGLKISRAEFEENLILKSQMPAFRKDLEPLLAVNAAKYNFDDDFKLVMDKIIAKFPGDTWKGVGRAR